MKRNAFLSVIAWLAIVAMLCMLTGCTAGVGATDLMADITPNPSDDVADLDEETVLTDFAVRLFQASAADGQNRSVSPLSVLYALAMTANGAKGDTLSQMESVLGSSVKTLNPYLYTYLSALSQDDALHLANSVWFTDDSRFKVESDFLQTNADYYGADVFRTPFDDATLNDINEWIETETDGMIEHVLDEIPDKAVMYLINALAFEAEWETVYSEDTVHPGRFTDESGAVHTTTFMYATDDHYIEDDHATGFIKYYQGRRYAFAALLPDEGVALNDYVAGLTGERLHRLLQNAKNTPVDTAIPKFEAVSDVELSDTLAAMGMPDAFDRERADFTALGHAVDGNVHINRVLHKTFISVAEQGTKAGAATVVEMVKATGLDRPENHVVYLNRPFVYLLIDCETNTPFFIGTMYQP